MSRNTKTVRSSFYSHRLISKKTKKLRERIVFRSFYLIAGCICFLIRSDDSVIHGLRKQLSAIRSGVKSVAVQLLPAAGNRKQVYPLCARISRDPAHYRQNHYNIGGKFTAFCAERFGAVGSAPSRHAVLPEYPQLFTQYPSTSSSCKTSG